MRKIIGLTLITYTIITPYLIYKVLNLGKISGMDGFIHVLAVVLMYVGMFLVWKWWEK